MKFRRFHRKSSDYGIMVPKLADTVRENKRYSTPLIEKLGPFKSLAFVKVVPGGLNNVYMRRRIKTASSEWDIAPLSPHGKIEHLMINPVSK